MPSGPVGLLITSLSECHHPGFPTHALITFLRNKQAFLSNVLSYAFYTIWLQMLITSFRVDSWDLSLSLGFYTWCNTYKACDINSLLARRDADRILLSAMWSLRQESGSPLEVSTMESCSSGTKGTSERQCGEAFLEHAHEALVATGERWTTASGSSLKIQRFALTPRNPTSSN